MKGGIAFEGYPITWSEIGPNYDTPLPLTKFNGKINGIHDTPLHKNIKLNTTP